jgi:hypothetical protein
MWSMPPRPLPDIRTLLDDPRRDRGPTLLAIGRWVVVALGAVAVLASAAVAWVLRLDSSLPDAVHVGVVALIVLGTLAVGLRAVQRLGPDFLLVFAIVAPIASWLIVCMLVVVVNGVAGDARQKRDVARIEAQLNDQARAASDR